MRRFIRMLLLIFIILTLVACSSEDSERYDFFYSDDEEVSNARLEKVLEAVHNKDKEALKELFAQNVVDNVENFDESVDKLLEYYHGNVVSITNEGSIVRKQKRLIYDKKEMDTSFNVATDEKTYYRIEMLDVIVDTGDPENEGVHSFYIIKWEDYVQIDILEREIEEYELGIHFELNDSSTSEE